MRGVSPRNEEGLKDYASNSTPGSTGRGGCSSVARKSIHPDARIDQVNFKRSRGYRRDSVDSERIWTFSFTFADPRRLLMHSIP